MKPRLLQCSTSTNEQVNSHDSEKCTASHPKEWKPKLSQKSSLHHPGVIGTPEKSVPHPIEDPKDLGTDAAPVQDKLSQVNNYENQNVIIAEHIRITESDRCRLTFGSFGTEFDSSRDFVSESHAVGSAENSSVEPSTSLSASVTESSSDETSVSKSEDLPYDQVRKSGSNSPASGLRSPQEVKALDLHTADGIPASTVAMVQQQPPPMAQMYPQVHVSHFANLMPYRHFVPPVYVPPMAMAGYSNNATYPHPSNGSSYFADVSSFTSPTGYAINAPGVVGGVAGLEDSSRLKYKDGNLYIPNPQVLS
ncbi:hypothetical protein U1Q18_006416 [Sarracenia purpurea var. burkii]